jgi:hypothetical protein
MFRRVKYPNDFHYNTSGQQISEEVINNWLEEMIDYMQSHKEEYVMTTKSGNTLLCVAREENYNGESFYNVMVAKNFMQLEVTNGGYVLSEEFRNDNQENQVNNFTISENGYIRIK